MSTQAKVLTEEKLKELLPNAMIFRGRCADLNACRETGIWLVDVNTKNKTGLSNMDYGILEVLVRRKNGANTEIFQRITSWQCTLFAMRHGGVDYWGSWKQATLTPLSTS
jgi:hypothetical protein